MKGIIIAAGGGSRLLPLTATTPKCLVSVGGRAILDHQIDALAAVGIGEVVIVGGYRIDRIASHLAAHPSGLQFDLIHNPFWSIASSIGSVWSARQHLNAPFMLMNGDTLFDRSIVAAAIADPAPGVTLVVEALGETHPDDMLVIVADNRVRDVAKTLDPAEATHRSLGLIVSAGGNDYAEALDAVIGEDGGVQAFHHAVIARLATRDAVTPLVIARAAHWQEVDRPEDVTRWEHDHRGKVD